MTEDERLALVLSTKRHLELVAEWDDAAAAHQAASDAFDLAGDDPGGERRAELLAEVAAGTAPPALVEAKQAMDAAQARMNAVHDTKGRTSRAYAQLQQDVGRAAPQELHDAIAAARDPLARAVERQRAAREVLEHARFGADAALIARREAALATAEGAQQSAQAALTAAKAALAVHVRAEIDAAVAATQGASASSVTR